MDRYKVKITEILTKELYIKADSIDEARNKVIDNYNKEKIILDWQDLSEVEFEVEEDNQ